MKTTRILPLCLLMLLPVTAARPADDSAPSLGSVVPADVHFFADWRNTEEYEQLMEPYAKACAQLMESGIGRDILDLALADAPQETRAHVRETARRVWSLLNKPDWKALTGHEGAFSFRLSFPIPEYLLIFRVPEGTAGARHQEMSAMMSGLAEEVGEMLLLEDSEKKGAQVSRVGIAGTPFGISVASKSNYVSISTSDLLIDGMLDLIGGDGTGSIAQHSTFKKGFEGLEGEAVSRLYFDLPGYVRFIGNMLGMAAGGLGNDPDAEGVFQMARTVIDEFARLGPLFSTGHVKGDRMVARTRMHLVQGEQPGFFEGLIAGQEPIEHWEGVVPQDALAFYFTSGIQPARVYDAVEGLIRKHLPRGKGMLERWERIQERMGFHVRRDLLSWIDGGWGCITLPPESGSWCAENVLFLRLLEEEAARALIVRVLTRVKEFLATRGQRLDFVEIPGLGEQVREVRLEALPWLRPVIGIRGDLLVIASSSSALKRVVDTYKQDAPNISSNPAYAAMQIPDRPMVEVFYMDMEGSLQGFANVLSGVGFALSMVPEKANNAQIRKLSPVLGKLAAFIRALDVVVDYGGWTRYDAEQHLMISEQTTRIRERIADF